MSFRRLLGAIVAMSILSTQSPARAEDDSVHFDIPPLIVTGVGLAAIASGGVLGFLASSNYDDARNDPTHRGATESFDQAETFVDVGNILLITGATLATFGLVWWLVTFEKGPDEQADVTVGIGPTSLQLEGSF